VNKLRENIKHRSNQKIIKFGKIESKKLRVEK